MEIEISNLENSFVITNSVDLNQNDSEIELRLLTDLDSKEFQSRIDKLTKNSSSKLNNIIKDLVFKNSTYKTKYEIYSNISKKIKLKFRDKSLHLELFKFVIGNRIEKDVSFTKTLQAEEILNEIACFYKIKKSLDYFKDKSILDLSHRNYRDEKEFIKSLKLKKFYFDHKIIKNIEESSYDSLLYELEGPLQLRRPIDLEFGYYRYLPILCNNYCDENYNEFCKLIKLTESELPEVNKYINDSCSNENILKNIIKKIFLKNCIFAHNYNEINYHPYKLMTKYCDYKNCKSDDCNNAHANMNEEIVYLFDFNYNNSTGYNVNLELKIIEDLKHLINSYLENKRNQAMKRVPVPVPLHSYIDNIYKSSRTLMDFKTRACKKRSLCSDIKLCEYFHSLLERRRKDCQLIIANNKPCDKVFVNAKWLSPKLCELEDSCEYFHTRNELFYDIRNFRRIYECPLEKKSGECSNYNYCAYKHTIDVNVDELSLPDSIKHEINSLINQYHVHKGESENLIKNSEDCKCRNCKSYISHKMVVFECGHNYCFKCYEKVKKCIYKCPKAQDKSLQILELNNGTLRNEMESIVISKEDSQLQLSQFDIFFNNDDENKSYHHEFTLNDNFISEDDDDFDSFEIIQKGILDL